MGAGKSRDGESESEEDIAERRRTLRQKLQELDGMLAQSPEAEVIDAPSSGATAGELYVNIVIGTSELASVPGMVGAIDQIASLSKPLGQREVMRRLEMGDDGMRANRVLHLAFTKDDTPTLVGCMSSTFQPPWTEQGCGHWGLLAVSPVHQGKGVAAALVRAGERRLEGVCHEIQMEYRHTVGEPDSEKLRSWYEDRLGFVCPHGPPSGCQGTQEFRMCRKRIPESVQQAGERRRLQEIRAWLVEQLAEEDDEPEQEDSSEDAEDVMEQEQEQEDSSEDAEDVMEMEPEQLVEQVSKEADPVLNDTL